MGSFCLSRKMDRLIFISLLIVAVNGQCPTNLTAICTDCVTYNDEMGCLYADSREESKFDNYQKALDHCRGLMGENAILAEAINEDQHNILVEIIKAAELYLEELSSPGGGVTFRRSQILL